MEYFFESNLAPNSTHLILNEDTTRHVLTVLRKQSGETIVITNGAGLKAEGLLNVIGKKKCELVIKEITAVPKPQSHYAIAIAFTKNNGRNEWMVEKLTELGCAAIIPIVTNRSVKTHLKTERLRGVAIAALLQSQQTWLPEIPEPISFQNFLKQPALPEQRLMAHCISTDTRRAFHTADPYANTIILIGPEGDFDEGEISQALTHNFTPVTLGSRRLRTETAAVTAAAYFNLYH